MKAFRKILIFVGISSVLLLAFSNCNKVSFDATKAGNPGDPPPAEPPRVQAVKNFISAVCMQQFNVEIVSDRLLCEELVKNDDALAHKIYYDPFSRTPPGQLTFEVLLNPFATLKDLNSPASEECISMIQSSRIAKGGPTEYSSDTAHAVVDSAPPCADFFIHF